MLNGYATLWHGVVKCIGWDKGFAKYRCQYLNISLITDIIKSSLNKSLFFI